MASLIRYWFVFETSKVPSPINLGCGVTARDLDDARALLRRRVFKGRDLPPVAGVIADVPLSSLDPRYVQPTMGPADTRGVWFPIPPRRPARRVVAGVLAVGAVAAAVAAYRRSTRPTDRLASPHSGQSAAHPLAGGGPWASVSWPARRRPA